MNRALMRGTSQFLRYRVRREIAEYECPRRRAHTRHPRAIRTYNSRMLTRRAFLRA